VNLWTQSISEALSFQRVLIQATTVDYGDYKMTEHRPDFPTMEQVEKGLLRAACALVSFLLPKMRGGRDS